jgi:hypothetical protein
LAGTLLIVGKKENAGTLNQGFTVYAFIHNLLNTRCYPKVPEI